MWRAKDRASDVRGRAISPQTSGSKQNLPMPIWVIREKEPAHLHKTAQRRKQDKDGQQMQAGNMLKRNSMEQGKTANRFPWNSELQKGKGGMKEGGQGGRNKGWKWSPPSVNGDVKNLQQGMNTGWPAVFEPVRCRESWRACSPASPLLWERRWRGDEQQWKIY